MVLWAAIQGARSVITVTGTRHRAKMNSLTLLVCIVAFEFSSQANPNPEDKEYDTGARVDGMSPPGGDGDEPDPPARTGALHSGCGFIMYTLTSRGPSSGTNALFSFLFFKYWEWSPWQPENNPGDDREKMHWDLYGTYSDKMDGLPADWIYVRQTTRPWDRWQIQTIFMKDTCKDKVYEYYCGGCWVSNDLNGGTWIKRTYPPL